MNVRLVWFDFLRSFAIIAVVLCHLANYVSISIMHSAAPYFAMLGNGLFVFMSGYLLNYNNKNIGSSKDFCVFLKKRFFRIYPLYWVSLLVIVVLPILYTLIFTNSSILYHLSLQNSIYNYCIYLAGMQILLPIYGMANIWFVGFIVLCYLTYPIIVHFSQNDKQVISYSAIIFILFLILRIATGIVDDRFFIFYFVFCAGIFLSTSHFFERPINAKLMISIISVLILSLALYLIHNYKIVNFPITAVEFYLFDVVLTDLIIIPGCILLVFLTQTELIKKYIEKGKSVFFVIALSSYAIYLFHWAILTPLDSLFHMLGISSQIQDVLLIVIGIPVVISISYFIQATETKVINHFFKKKVSGKLSEASIS